VLDAAGDQSRRPIVGCRVEKEEKVMCSLGVWCTVCPGMTGSLLEGEGSRGEQRISKSIAVVGLKAMNNGFHPRDVNNISNS